jgi:hypothetical protein
MACGVGEKMRRRKRMIKRDWSSMWWLMERERERVSERERERESSMG